MGEARRRERFIQRCDHCGCDREHVIEAGVYLGGYMVAVGHLCPACYDALSNLPEERFGEWFAGPVARRDAVEGSRG